MKKLGWRGSVPLIDWIYAEGHRFEFFQAVRLLEATATREANQGSARPGVPLGAGPDPQREALRLRAAIHFKFPPRDVAEIRPPKDDRPTPELVANFFSLAGARSPLPDWVAELLLQQERVGDTALRDFLDIFHHRLLSLLYRVQLEHRPWLDPYLLAHRPDDRLGSARATNPMARLLLCFAGLGLPELQDRMPIGNEELLPYAGLLWHKPRSLPALVRLLQHALSVEVGVRSRIGVWRSIEPEDRSRIGKASGSTVGQHRLGAMNNILGQTTVLGARVWDAQGRFDVVLGPLSPQQADDFLPKASGYRHVEALVRFYAGDMFTVNLILVLKKASALQLGSSRLSWTSWIRPGPVRSPREIHLPLLT